MGYDDGAPRREVTLFINADLAARCRATVGNLSAPVQNLLAIDLEQQEMRAAANNAANEQAIDAFAALHGAEGSLSGELQAP